jgi:hypothetical protein
LEDEGGPPAHGDEEAEEHVGGCPHAGGGRGSAGTIEINYKSIASSFGVHVLTITTLLTTKDTDHRSVLFFLGPKSESEKLKVLIYLT